MFKAKLRWFLASSSHSPLVWVYLGIYRLVIWLAVLVLRRYHSVVAIYLCRGCAKGDITPGISDIDLIVVIANGSKEKHSIQRAFQFLGLITAGVIDYYPNFARSKEAVEHCWRTTPCWQYRFHEGKRTWKVLYGTDLLASLPPLTETQRIGSCYAEMNHWWLAFAQQLLKTTDHHQDTVMRNVICYKAICELLNLDCAMRTGTYRRNRSEGLERCNTDFARRLKALSAERFLPPDDQLMDETLKLLLTFFINLWDGFSDRPFLPIHNGTSQLVDCQAGDLQVGDDTRQHLQVLHEYLQTHWREKCLGTHLVKSAFFDFDDLLLIIDIAEDMLPTIQEITGLTRLKRHVQPVPPEQIFLFLRLGPMAFPITPIKPRDLHRGILTPATAPDVFLQLGVSPVYWTDYTKWYLSDWQANDQWVNACARKRLQLSLIATSAESRRVVYPLTVPAIEREAERIFGSHHVRSFADALRRGC